MTTMAKGRPNEDMKTGLHISYTNNLIATLEIRIKCERKASGFTVKAIVERRRGSSQLGKYAHIEYGAEGGEP